jgi:hypothetical protein
MLEIMKSFHVLTVVFNVIMKMKIVSKWCWANVAKHEKTSADQETDEEEMTDHEWVTNQDARKFVVLLWLHLMQEGNEGIPIFAIETRTVSVNQEDTVCYAW